MPAYQSMLHPLSLHDGQQVVAEERRTPDVGAEVTARRRGVVEHEVAGSTTTG